MRRESRQKVEGNTIMNDIRYALTSKPVIMILSISAVIRGLFQFVLLPNSPSPLGPDEGTYAALAKYVSQGLPVQDFPFFGPELYNSSKSIALPSAFLIKLGVGELTAVRTVSSVYGLTSTLIVALSFIAYLRLRNQNIQELSSSLNKKFIFMLALFAFFPSNFVWSTIGLRESGSQFWLIATFYLILKLMKSSGRDLWKFTAFTAIALALAYGTRPETALVFSIVALFFSTTALIRLRSVLPIIAILLGIFAGQVFSTTTATTAPTAPTAPTATTATTATVNPLETLQNQLLTIKLFQFERIENAFGAESALPISTCQISSNEIISSIRCNLFELPYRLFAFLFRPLIFFDQGSATLTFAALENLGWLILVPFSIWITLREREITVDRFINFSLIAYVLVFASAASLYEGNLGTAFRHKSTILWPLIFILMIAPNILPKSRRKVTTVS